MDNLCKVIVLVFTAPSNIKMPENTNDQLEAKDLWKAIKSELEIILSPSNYQTWVANTKAEYADTNTLVVTCTSEFIRSRLETKLNAFIKQTAEKILKKPISIIYQIKKEGLDERKDIFEEPTSLFGQLQQPKYVNTNDVKVKAGLAPRYTFDSYVMGKNNQLAYAIAVAVANNPGTQYNPVFFYSNVGLGKTHLAQAIGNKIIDDNPQIKVVYCTGETFTNELIEQIQNAKLGKGKKTPYEFREKYRKIDVLIVDDIQFIAGKEATQEEFFHTFNALRESQKQVIVTSDRPPRDLKNIAERITSRFGSGVIADIQFPDVETRTAILRVKRDNSGEQIPNSVLDFIAEKVSSNIRELEGAYLQVLTFSKTLGLDITLEVAAQALGQSIIKETKFKPINLNQILKQVCIYYSVKSSDLKGPKRNKELVIPRQMLMYLIKDLTQTPLMSIGEFLGGRDHTTIMHGIAKVETQSVKDINTAKDIQNLKKLIYED